MSNVLLARPTTITGAIITCTKLGTAGTDFFIKVMEADIDWHDRVEETTGDGDAARSLDISHFGYTSLVFSGFMLAHSVAGSWDLIANLQNSAKNPLAASLKLNTSTSEILTIAKGVIPRWRIRYRRGFATIPCVVTVLTTDSSAAWGDT